MEFPKDIVSFIKQEETAYETQEVRVFDNYSFQMKNHIQTSLSMKYGKFLYSTNDLRTKYPKKNIILPILRLRYRAQNIDVKDIIIYIDEPEKFHLSFLVKKYWDDVFTVKNDIDSFLDKAVEENIDLGGCLVKKGNGAVPELERLQGIVFCDQTDILGGPIGFKFNFSPDNLRAKAKQGWGDKKNGATIDLDELVRLAKKEKDAPTTTQVQSNQTPGKNIEVYVVRGQMPDSYLREKGDDETLVSQVQIVAFYQNKKGKVGQILYRAKEVEEIYKFHNPEEMFNRALGFGGVEELFDAQIWTDFAQIHKTNMLKAASKNVFYTNDDDYANRNKIKDMENLEITVVKDGAAIHQVPTGTPNIQLFTESLNEWENYAKQVGSASNTMLGQPSPHVMPFRLLALQNQESHALHDYRAGKFAKFVESILRDWVIPEMTKEIVKGKKFLATLTSDEMQWVMDRVSTNMATKAQTEDVLSGRIPEDLEILKQKSKQEFLKKGNKHVFEILKDELRGVELQIKIDISGKQKDLSLMADKLTNVLKEYLAAPQMRQDPFALKLLNRMLEAAGMSPVDLSDFENISAIPQVPNQFPNQIPNQTLPQIPNRTTVPA